MRYYMEDPFSDATIQDELRQWFDMTYGSCLDSIIGRELTGGDIWCLLNSELRDPFIPIFFIFGIFVFPILGWLEPEKKGKK